MNTQQMVQRVFDNKMKKQIAELKNMIHEFGKKDESLLIEELLEALNEYLEDIYWEDDKKVLKILDRVSFKHSIKETEVLLARIMLNKLNDFRYRIK